jgi:hypothetical protein
MMIWAADQDPRFSLCSLVDTQVVASRIEETKVAWVLAAIGRSGPFTTWACDRCWRPSGMRREQPGLVIAKG